MKPSLARFWGETCDNPISILDAMIDASREPGASPLHVMDFDASNAFDLVPHAYLQVALRSIHAPDDVLGWFRSNYQGHFRICRTAYTDEYDLDEAQRLHLKSGAFQGIRWTL